MRFSAKHLAYSDMPSFSSQLSFIAVGKRATAIIVISSGGSHLARACDVFFENGAC